MNLRILEELVVVLAASSLIITLSHKLKIPAVAGFLLTGILIGPSGLGLIKDTHVIGVLAEIGVVMLLFTIGIEFSLKRLNQIKKHFWLGGGTQVVLTILAAAAFLRVFGRSLSEGVFYGFLISLSSTAVVLKILSDRSEMDSPHGKFSTGILLFQDMAIVPMIALVPLLANVHALSIKGILGRFLLSGLAIAAVFFLARSLMPRVLYLIVKTKIREVFIIAALFLCLAMALLTSSLGLSLALGAFLAGIIISESEYSHQVVSDILPFKDLFNSIFFISIGLLLNTAEVWNEKYFILALSLSIFALKTTIVLLTGKILKQNPRVSLIAALALAQIGEFSFVVAGVGRANGLMADAIFQAFIASSVLTIFATPFLIRLSPLIADKSESLLGWTARHQGTDDNILKELANHVIVAGYGLNGQNLVRVLKEAGIGFVILDLNPDIVKSALDRGEPIIFGDISGRDIQLAAGIRRAKSIVFAISDPESTRRGVKIARQLNSDIFILVRTRYASEIDGLYALGANEVIPEEFETSIEIFCRVLEEFHVPRNLIDAQIKIVRSERYGLLREGTAVRPTLERISELLTAGTADTFFVKKGSPAAGKSLRELNLRKLTGATVIAVVRGEKSYASPAADFVIEENDTLVLVASHQDMDRAFQFMGS